MMTTDGEGFQCTDDLPAQRRRRRRIFSDLTGNKSKGSFTAESLCYLARVFPAVAPDAQIIWSQRAAG